MPPTEKSNLTFYLSETTSSVITTLAMAERLSKNEAMTVLVHAGARYLANIKDSAALNAAINELRKEA